MSWDCRIFRSPTSRSSPVAVDEASSEWEFVEEGCDSETSVVV